MDQHLKTLEDKIQESNESLKKLLRGINKKVNSVNIIIMRKLSQKSLDLKLFLMNYLSKIIFRDQ